MTRNIVSVPGGLPPGYTSHYQTGAMVPPAMVQRHADLTVDVATATENFSPFGANSFFSTCTEDIFSLSYSGRLGLLDLLNFRPTDEYTKEVEFLTSIRPDEPTPGTYSVGHVANACEAPNGIQYSGASLTKSGFGLYGRRSKTRTILQPEKRCATSPRYRLDGKVIGSENEWDLITTMAVLLNDVRRAVISGNESTTGQFDGLEQWVANTYANDMLNSLVVDWNDKPMQVPTGGGEEIIVNGTTIPGPINIVDVLLEVNARINQRLSWGEATQGKTFSPGQKFLLMPTTAIRALLNFYTCWSTCTSSTVTMQMDTLEAKDARKQLNGGLFGYGFIELDGEIIPILPYDWGLLSGTPADPRVDMYLLTTGIGDIRFWEGQFLSAETALKRYMADAPDSDFRSLDGGRVFVKRITDNLCRSLSVWMALRLFCYAPYAQARIQDIDVSPYLGHVSSDPISDFFPG